MQGFLSTSSAVSRSQLEDARILSRVASGDQDAFARLFDRHSPKVLGLLIRTLGDREEAEEVLQEVFLQAWEQADRYQQGRSSPKGWLFMMARSRALDRMRSRGARMRREDNVAKAASGQGMAPVGTRRLEARERQRKVQCALDTLPDEQRRCLEMAYFEGLTQSQIATRLDVPLGTVKSRILLGMKKLKQALDARS